MVSKMVLEAKSKVLSKKKVPAMAARTKVDVFLKTVRLIVAHSDIFENLENYPPSRASSYKPGEMSNSIQGCH